MSNVEHFVVVMCDGTHLFTGGVVGDISPTSLSHIIFDSREDYVTLNLAEGGGEVDIDPDTVVHILKYNTSGEIVDEWDDGSSVTRVDLLDGTSIYETGFRTFLEITTALSTAGAVQTSAGVVSRDNVAEVVEYVYGEVNIREYNSPKPESGADYVLYTEVGTFDVTLSGDLTALLDTDEDTLVVFGHAGNQICVRQGLINAIVHRS